MKTSIVLLAAALSGCGIIEQHGDIIKAMNPCMYGADCSESARNPLNYTTSPSGPTHYYTYSSGGKTRYGSFTLY